jgi:hypothetical protein
MSAMNAGVYEWRFDCDDDDAELVRFLADLLGLEQASTHDRIIEFRYEDAVLYVYQPACARPLRNDSYERIGAALQGVEYEH